MRNPLLGPLQIGALITGRLYRSSNLLLAKPVNNVEGAFPQRRYHRNRVVPWTFVITNTFPAPVSSNSTLLDYLLHHQIYPTSSQARRAIRFCEVLVLPKGETFDPPKAAANLISPSTKLCGSDSVHQLTRLADDAQTYSVELTKFVYPPSMLTSMAFQRHDWVVYENSEIAIVHKPANLTTIDGGTDSRDDLQSLLPFILYPPPGTTMLPRPVHRLDRLTSGLVIVAKTQSALQRFSALFADRAIRKTYTAVVFGQPNSFQLSNWSDDGSYNSGVIDYPIDGKPAVTSWKVVETNGNYSRIQLHPTTGRYHQLRRHLAYCLKAPIVGDVKYDLVGLGNSNDDDEKAVEARKAHRKLGLFLCCHQLEFDYPGASCEHTTNPPSNSPVVRESSSGPAHSYSIIEDEQLGTKRMQVSLSLPDKMFQLFQPPELINKP